MKKKIGISVIGVVFVAAIVILITVKETGKKERPDLGYEDVDVYETGRLEGDFGFGPINEEFLSFQDTSLDAETRYRAKKAFPVNGLGMIPSPVPEETHDGVRAKSVKVTIYDDVYDLRDPDNDGDRSDSLLPPAREQWDCGACWAFSSYGAIESLLFSRMGFLSDFSENHVLFSSGYDWTGCQGGNVDMMMAYLSRGQGPVHEKDDPFTQHPNGGVCRDCGPVRYIDSGIKLKVRSSVSDIFYIKQALLEYGPLYVSMNWSSGFYHPSDYTYRSETYGANHAVTLVGWDDRKTVIGVDYPGAFIVRNSWGSDWGEDGYFYVSYDDKSFAYSSMVAFKDEPDSLLPVDRIYYHDDLGMTSSTGFGKPHAWGACAFTAEAEGDLVAVGLYTTAYNTNYEVSIHSDMISGKLSRRLAEPVIGSLTGKGFHTIRMKESIELAEGEDFIVAVKFHTPDSNWPIPLERPFPDYSSAAQARSGESFLSNDGVSWQDTTATFAQTSVCIKALVREEKCHGTDLVVSGPAGEGAFLTPTKDGAWVKAVVTTDCGEPVFDADVIASMGDGRPDLVLHDDGQHNDDLFNDGIYANAVDGAQPPEPSAIRVRASWGDSQAYTSSKSLDETSGSDSGGGGGCFIHSFE